MLEPRGRGDTWRQHTSAFHAKAKDFDIGEIGTRL